MPLLSRVLGSAILRALWRTPGRIVSVIALVAVAITVYAGTFIGIEHIADTAQTLYRDLRLFELQLDVEPTALDGVPTADWLRARVPGLKDATWRLQVPGTLERLEGATVASSKPRFVAGAEVIALPPDVRPAVGDVLLTQGTFLAAGHSREVIIDKTFAEDSGINLGDTLTLRVQGRAISVTVRGIGVLPEYLVTSVLQSYRVPIRGTLAAVLLSQEQVAEVLEHPLINSLVLTLSPGADREAVRAALTTQLTAAGVSVRATLLPEDQFSVSCTRVRLLSFRDFLPTLIVIFNGLAFLVLLLIVRRLGHLWRREIGTLLSCGFGRGSLLLSWGGALLIPVALGGLVGAFGALRLARQVSEQFLFGTGFPILLPLRSLRPLWRAELLAFFIVWPAVLLPLVPMLMRTPAQLLRDDTQEEEDSLLLKAIRAIGRPLDRLLWLRTPEKLGFRNVFRRPGLFVSSAVCISGMLVAAASMYLFETALLRGLTQFLSSQRWEYLVELNQPMTESALEPLLKGAGVASWEGLSAVEGTVRAHGKERSYSLLAESLSSTLRIPGGLGMVTGFYLQKESNPEVAINLRLSKDLGIGVGDLLEVIIGPSGPSTQLRVIGVTTNYAANQVFISRQTLAALLGRPLLIQAAVLVGAKAGRPLTAEQLSALPQVARVVPWAVIYTSSLKNCDALTSFVRLYGDLSTLVAALLILVIIQVSVSDRAAEYALLRSLGFSGLDFFRMLFAEVFVLSVSAILLSLPLTRLATWIFQQRLMQISDYVPIEVTVSAWLKLMAPVLLLMLLSAVPAALRAARIVPALALRARMMG